MGKTGYTSQQTNQPANPRRPDNLSAPVDEHADYGAHGSFDQQARRKSQQLWADTHVSLLSFLGFAGLTGLLGGLAILRKTR